MAKFWWLRLISENLNKSGKSKEITTCDIWESQQGYSQID